MKLPLALTVSALVELLSKTTVVPPDKPVTVPPMVAVLVPPQPLISNAAAKQSKHVAVFKNFIIVLAFKKLGRNAESWLFDKPKLF